MIYRHQRDGAVFGLIPQPHIVLFHGNGIPLGRFFPNDRPDIPGLHIPDEKPGILKIDHIRLPSLFDPPHGEGLGLQLQQFVVHTPLLQQLGVRAAFHQLAVIQHDQMIRTTQGGEAVGDRDGGPALDELVQGILDGPLGLGVH